MEREILDRVRGFIEAERMAEKGMKVAVALSGGRDSVCLLGILRLLQPELGIELSAVHVDHGLRETAARDRAFCEELCAREGIPLTVRAVDVKARVRETGESIEEAARNLRYGVFASLPADRVALAHHQGDQAETVLMNLLRGSGLRGLGGIRPVRDGRYIRPLLCLSPEEILAFDEARGLAWTEDETNADLSFTRNRIRRELIPELGRSYNPAVRETLCREAALLRQDADCLDHLAEEACAAMGGVLRCGTLTALHPALRSRVILLFLREKNGDRSLCENAVRLTEELAARPAEQAEGRRLSLPGDLTLIRKNDIIDAYNVDSFEEGIPPAKIVLPFRTVLPDGTEFLAEPGTPPGREALTALGPEEEWIPADAVISGEAVLRSRREGDFLRIFDSRHRLCEKSLQDLFTDAKIPREKRDAVPLAAVGSEIVWAAGIRLSDAFRLTGAETTAVHFCINHPDGEKTEETMANQVEGKDIKVLIDEQTLENRIREMAEQISKDYEGKELTLTCILKGGVMFMTQLAKYITVPVTMDFMVLSSYGDDLVSSGQVKIVKDMEGSIEGKDVLVVEDIVDTGRTLHFLEKILEDRGPASLAIATMLDKPDRRVCEMTPKYTGFTIEDKFVVGYGLDYAQRYRNLRYIGYIE